MFSIISNWPVSKGVTLKLNKEINQNDCKIIKKIMIIVHAQVSTFSKMTCETKTSLIVLWLLYQFPAK